MKQSLFPWDCLQREGLGDCLASCVWESGREPKKPAESKRSRGELALRVQTEHPGVWNLLERQAWGFLSKLLFGLAEFGEAGWGHNPINLPRMYVQNYLSYIISFFPLTHTIQWGPKYWPGIWAKGANSVFQQPFPQFPWRVVWGPCIDSNWSVPLIHPQAVMRGRKWACVSCIKSQLDYLGPFSSTSLWLFPQAVQRPGQWD